MKAIILAAGKGERMLPITKKLPKPLIVVSGKTLLDHIFDSLPAEVREVIVVIGYLGNKIKRYLGDNYKGRKVEYVIQKKINGTAEALLAAKLFFEPQDDRFLVFYGDELPSKREVKNLLSHRYSLLCHKITASIATGVAEIDERGRILKISEKPGKLHPPVIAAGGAMVLGKEIFRFKPRRHPNGEYCLTSMLNKFLKKHSFFAVIGSPDLYFITAKDIDKFN